MPWGENRRKYIEGSNESRSIEEHFNDGDREKGRSVSLWKSTEEGERIRNERRGQLVSLSQSTGEEAKGDGKVKPL